MEAVIFDMDGTLSDCSHRRHHVATKPKNWAAFNAGIAEDSPNAPIIQLARIIAAQGYKIVVCTGRERQYEAQTRDWMRRHVVPCDALYMRPNKDYRADDVVKAELLAEIGNYPFDIVRTTGSEAGT